MTDAAVSVRSRSAHPAQGPRGVRFYRVIRDYAVVFTLLILVAVVAAGNPSFLSVTNLTNMLSQWAPAGIIAAGMTFIALTGGFDLSVASAFSLCAVVAAIIGQRSAPPVAFLAAIGAGAAVGLVNGFLIARVRINPYITTVGTSFILNGVALLCTGNAAYIVSNPDFANLGAGQIFGVSYSGIILVVALVALQFVLSRTIYGQLVYSVGGNYEASWLSGIRVELVVGSTYVLLGICAGIAGSITASQLSSAQANMDSSLIFDVLTIVVVGGTSLAGGSGAVWRTAVGLAIIATISNGFVLIGISPYYQDVIKGTIIVAALSLDVLLGRLTRNSRNGVVSQIVGFIGSNIERVRQRFGNQEQRRAAEAWRLEREEDAIAGIVSKVLTQVTAKQRAGLEDPSFRRLAFEVAFAEYAIGLASEMAGDGHYVNVIDPITDIRATISRLAAIPQIDHAAATTGSAPASLTLDRPATSQKTSESRLKPGHARQQSEAMPPGSPAAPIVHRMPARGALCVGAEARTVVEWILARCDSAPSRCAVQDPNTAVSYAELFDWSGRIAASLRAEGVCSGDIVGLVIGPSAMAIVCLVGIWRSGAAFVAMDPDAPRHWTDERLKRIGCRLVVGETSEPRSRRFALSDLLARGAPFSLTAAQTANPDGLAYVAFTSGSMDEPKAVAIEHRHLSAYVEGLDEKLGWDTRGRFGFVSSLHVDLGYSTLFPALAGGGTVLICPTEFRLDVPGLAHFLSEGYDSLKITPTHLSALLEHSEGARCLPRSVLICGGELLSWDLVDAVWAVRPELEIFNHYGPTETTIGATAFRVPRDPAARNSSSVPIGTPLRGVSLELRRRGEFGGNNGEIVISGATVGRGYLEVDGDEDYSTAYDGGDIGTNGSYSTGDIASQLPDGTFVFNGRVDEQIQVRGYRVDLHTVKTTMGSLPGVKSVEVNFDRESQTICAAVVAEDPVHPVTEQQLRSSLRQKLPEVWIPAHLAVMKTTRVGVNGKASGRSRPYPHRRSARIDAES